MGKQRILAACAAIVMAVNILFSGTIPVSAETSGDDFLIDNGILTGYTGTAEKVVIPNGVTSIGGFAFELNQTIKEVILPDGVTFIGMHAFNGCRNLKSVTIPEGVETIGDAAFYNCDSLEKLTLPASVKEIGENAFGYRNFCTVALYGETGTYAEEYAKDYAIPFCSVGLDIKKDESSTYAESAADGVVITCTGKPSKELANVYTRGGAFGWSQDALVNKADYTVSGEDSTTVVFDKEFLGNLLGRYIFTLEYTDGRKAEAVVTIDYHTTPEPDENGFAIRRGVLWGYSGNAEKVVVPDGVTVVETSAFHGNANIKEVILPDSVTYVGEMAFYDCFGLSSITLSKGLTRILQNTFWDCTSLKTVVFPEGLQQIDSNAFIGCGSLQEIALPGSITKIENLAFNGSVDLTSVTIAAGATGIESNAFAISEEQMTIYGETGSEAETYAKERNIPFSSIGLEIKKESTDKQYLYGNEKGLTITCSGALSELTGVSVDGTPVAETDYTKKEGSTIVTFTQEFMETLSEGKHIFTLEYTDGRKSEAAVTVLRVLPGDADGDGKMTTSDALAILKHLAKLPQKDFIEAAANVDGEGGITTQDALMILKCLAGLA